MKTLFTALAAAIAIAATPALAVDAPAAAPAAAKPKMTTSDTTIGDLLDNPAAKAILVKHAPDLVNNPQIEMARSMTLKQIQGFAADQMPEALLVKIDADLAAIQ